MKSSVRVCVFLYSVLLCFLFRYTRAHTFDAMPTWEGMNIFNIMAECWVWQMNCIDFIISLVILVFSFFLFCSSDFVRFLLCFFFFFIYIVVVVFFFLRFRFLFLFFLAREMEWNIPIRISRRIHGIGSVAPAVCVCSACRAHKILCALLFLLRANIYFVENLIKSETDDNNEPRESWIGIWEEMDVCGRECFQCIHVHTLDSINHFILLLLFEYGRFVAHRMNAM